MAGLLLCSVPGRTEPAHAALAAGYWGLRNNEPHELAVQLELRPGVRWWWIRPTAGLLQSTDGTQYVFGGVLLEVPLFSGLTLSPGFAPGLRTVNGVRNMGSVVLFKSSLELAAPLTPGLRALVSFAHISNGKLGKPNPGVETLLVGLEVALE